MMRHPSEAELRDLVARQAGSFYPVSDDEVDEIGGAVPGALEACEASFSRIRNKYYQDDSGKTRLDPLHGCQWTAFLYRLSRELYERAGGLCDKIYALLRALSGADLYYQVGLPDVLFFDHPLGAVMGRASYSNYLSFSQSCTVGNNHGIYPTFGESVFMLSDSKVIGDCRIGHDVIISAGAFVKDEDVPSGSLVFGASPNLTIKADRLDYVRTYAERVFRYDI